MNAPCRLLSRILIGLLVAGLTAILAAAMPSAALAAAVPSGAQAHVVAQSDCSTERATFRKTKADLDSARSALSATLAARDSARAAYNADPSRANSRALRTAIARVTDARASRAALRAEMAEARAVLDNCLSPIKIGTFYFNGEYDAPTVPTTVRGLVPGTFYGLMVPDYCGDGCGPGQFANTYGTIRADLPITLCRNGAPSSFRDPTNTTTGTIVLMDQNAQVVATRTVRLPAGTCTF